MDQIIRKIPTSIGFLIKEPIVLFVIFLNGLIFIILDVNPNVSNSYPWLELVDIVCISYFIFEAILKIYSLSLKGYLSDNWNKFDAVIVISSIPILLEPIIPSIAGNFAWTPVLRMTRLFRLAKFLRLGRLIKYAGREGALSTIRFPIYFILFLVTSNFLLSLIYLPAHIKNFIDIIYAPLLILASVSIISKISLIIQKSIFNPYIEETYSKSSEAIINLSRTAFVIILWSIGMVVAIEVAGFNSFSLIAGLGIGSLAVAFAAQDALGNIIAGVSLFAQKNFEIGDYLKIGDYEGIVISLGLRSFILETRDKSRISIPNKNINSLPIENLSVRKRLKDKICMQLSSSLTSEELNNSRDIIQNTCSNYNLIDTYRIKLLELRYTHNIEVTFIINIDDIKKEYKDINLMDITPQIGTQLYLKIFEDLEKSDLTPENRIMFAQNV
tara:strand:+ start:354 stop:1679 length:1326 start_codon:yes stop_codon:yes gene_type:complete